MQLCNRAKTTYIWSKIKIFMKIFRNSATGLNTNVFSEGLNSLLHATSQQGLNDINLFENKNLLEKSSYATAQQDLSQINSEKFLIPFSMQLRNRAKTTYICSKIKIFLKDLRNSATGLNTNVF